GTFKSREDYRKQKELDDARKAGLAPAEVDENGVSINPHIPDYMKVAPWYSVNDATPVSDEEEDEDSLKIDEAKVDESKQMDFAKVEKHVRTTGGGSTGTVRNLRIREDTAKYLWNLDVNSPYYDPKTRSMREDPFLDSDPNEKFYEGDNKFRTSGQTIEFQQLNFHAYEAFEKGQDIHPQAAPSQAEFLYKNFKQETSLPRTKYEEDVFINNHKSVWGSWWKGHQWGYKCCKQFIRNSYCTGTSGIEATEASVDLMKANIARKEATEEKPAVVEKNIATWGTDVPENVVLDQNRLAKALKKVTAEDMEALSNEESPSQRLDEGLTALVAFRNQVKQNLRNKQEIFSVFSRSIIRFSK
ncbi:hypothetical protein GIB67_020316, partial [Kingdonia uniflora]